jgi:hypothetical protein
MDFMDEREIKKSVKTEKLANEIIEKFGLYSINQDDIMILADIYKRRNLDYYSCMIEQNFILMNQLTRIEKLLSALVEKG